MKQVSNIKDMSLQSGLVWPHGRIAVIDIVLLFLEDGQQQRHLRTGNFILSSQQIRVSSYPEDPHTRT
jgi:predicted membrane protein